MCCEATTDDVQTVLDSYDVSLSFQEIEEIHEQLDHKDILAGACYFCSPEIQKNSVLSDIEDHLQRNGLIPLGIKRFVAEELDDCKGHNQ
jgi:hypothetical protein